MVITTILCGVQSQEAAPQPPYWVKYDPNTEEIRIEWLSVPAALTYTIEYEDTTGTVNTLSTTAITGTSGLIPCTSGATGEPLDITLGYTTASGAISSQSIPVTMLCANVPDSPSAPVLLLSTLDIILIDWGIPASDGGSPILGYSLWIKAENDPAYLLAYNGTQDPTTRQLAIREYNSLPLTVTAYTVAVRAYNWVGAGPDTELDLVFVAASSSAKDSQLSGAVFEVDSDGEHTGNINVKAAVPAPIALQAADITGNDMSVGGSNAFLQVEEKCTVGLNYRCEPVPGAPKILEGQVFQRMDDVGSGRYETLLDIKR